jgi:hypothetical protein
MNALNGGGSRLFRKCDLPRSPYFFTRAGKKSAEKYLLIAGRFDQRA